MSSGVKFSLIDLLQARRRGLSYRVFWPFSTPNRISSVPNLMRYIRGNVFKKLTVIAGPKYPFRFPNDGHASPTNLIKTDKNLYITSDLTHP
jgi:hypothetical protein